MAVVKCTKCGKVFNTEGAILKPIGMVDIGNAALNAAAPAYAVQLISIGMNIRIRRGLTLLGNSSLLSRMTNFGVSSKRSSPGE
jgi:hypothetical protein